MVRRSPICVATVASMMEVTVKLTPGTMVETMRLPMAVEALSAPPVRLMMLVACTPVFGIVTVPATRVPVPLFDVEMRGESSVVMLPPHCDGYTSERARDGLHVGLVLRVVDAELRSERICG